MGNAVNDHSGFDQKLQDQDLDNNIASMNISENNEDLLNNINEAEFDHDIENEESEESELALLKEAVSNEQDKFLRLFAEFENYKKRTSKERMDLFKTANQEVIVAMLPVVDDFERAMKELSKDQSCF